MQKIIALTVMVIILVVIAFFVVSRDGSEVPVMSPVPTSTPTLTVKKSPTPAPTVSKAIVVYSDSGYSPLTITVKKGDIVVFKNKSSGTMWTASAIHPTHKVYPGSDIAKCGTSSQTDIFDACKGYGPGESREFKFNEKGAWKYHNHLQSSHTGTIIVE